MSRPKTPNRRQRRAVLTRRFKETVQARVAKDPAFRSALLREGMEAMLAGGAETGKALHGYLKAPPSPT